MKKAGMVLGIVGGALSLLMALIFIIVGILLMTVDSSALMNFLDSVRAEAAFPSSMMLFNWTTDIIGIVFIVFGVLKAVCGVLGLIGGLSVNKKNVMAGVLMIVAAGVSLLLTGGYITTILFTLGGIFALIKEKPPVMPYQQPPVQ